jgi:hypothetical protein
VIASPQVSGRSKLSLGNRTKVKCRVCSARPYCHKVTEMVGPCHHSMVRPQVADGGTASKHKG